MVRLENAAYEIDCWLLVPKLKLSATNNRDNRIILTSKKSTNKITGIGAGWYGCLDEFSLPLDGFPLPPPRF